MKKIEIKLIPICLHLQLNNKTELKALKKRLNKIIKDQNIRK